MIIHVNRAIQTRADPHFVCRRISEPRARLARHDLLALGSGCPKARWRLGGDMHVDKGRPRPGGDFLDVTVGYRRPAEACRGRLSVPPRKRPRKRAVVSSLLPLGTEAPRCHNEPDMIGA